MKTIILTIATFLTLNISAQTSSIERIEIITNPSDMTPVTRADVNEINLRLEGLEKFGKKHRTGNHLIIGGTSLLGIGSLLLATNTIKPSNKGGLVQKAKKDYYRRNNIGMAFIGIGSVLSSVGVVINIDSFRHLKNKK